METFKEWLATQVDAPRGPATTFARAVRNIPDEAVWRKMFYKRQIAAVYRLYLASMGLPIPERMPLPATFNSKARQELLFETYGDDIPDGILRIRSFQMLPRERAALYRSGYTTAEIAKQAGISQQAVGSSLRRMGVCVSERPTKHSVLPLETIKDLYLSGLTQREIAAQFGVSNEVIGLRLRKLKITRTERSYGLRQEEWVKHKESGALKLFSVSKKNAAQLGKVWNLSFKEWWAVWEASGKWDVRGYVRAFNPCMALIDSSKPYELGNVKITTVGKKIAAGRFASTKRKAA